MWEEKDIKSFWKDDLNLENTFLLTLKDSVFFPENEIQEYR